MKRHIVVGMVVMGLLVAFGCDRKSEQEDEPRGVVTESSRSEEKTSGDDEKAPTQEEAPTEESAEVDMSDAARSINDFSHDILLRAGQGNAAVSPTSISAAMGMAYAGADGKTAEEIATVFHYDDNAIASMGALQSTLAERDGDFGKRGSIEFSLVNDVWLQKDFEVGQDYLSTVKEGFEATPRSIDFKRDPTAAKKKINDYVSEQTESRIPELLPDGIITKMTRTVLTNAIYLKASWAQQFSEDATQSGTFHAPDGDVEAQMMSNSEYYRLGEAKNLQAVELPYVGDKLAALVVVPDKGKLGAVEEQLDADGFADVRQSLERKYTALKMPKFEVRKKSLMGEQLKQMGMPHAFSDDADFDAIHEKLTISEVVHEAYMKVDENGTEAAAATAVAMRATSMPPEPTKFVVDRPFLFYVYDRPTGAVLFVARIVNPTK